MCAAIGGSSSPVRVEHGDLWVDVRDFGAKADGGVTDNAGPFQAAVDALIARLASNPYAKGVVFIPSGKQPYVVTRTVWVDAPNVEIQGEGWGSHVVMHGFFKQSVFMFGVRRVEQELVNGQWQPRTIQPQNRPDLYGKLDSSAVSAPGLRWGIRTQGSTLVQFQGNCMSSGQKSSAGYPFLDNWSETSKLTIEFCLDYPSGQSIPALTPILGMGDILYESSPFLVFAPDGNSLGMSFRTSDLGSGLFSPRRGFTFSLAGAVAPYRVAIQLDLANAVCTAFVNGVQVALQNPNNMGTTGTYPFVAGTGMTLSQNENYAFQIGAHGWGGGMLTSTLNPGADIAIYGLRLSNNIRYQNRGVGLSQKRIDSPGSPINDYYSYFTLDDNAICCLACTDHPTTSGRTVSVLNGNVAGVGGACSGIFFNGTNAGGIPGNAIRDLYVDGAPGGGQVVCIGGVLEMTIDNVKAVNGYNGVGNLVLFANYNVYINNSWLDGYDSAYFGAFQIAYGRDVYIGNPGRVGIRHLGGDGCWDNVFIAFPTPVIECIVKIRNGLYGGNFTFKNFLVDFEGPPFAQAAVYCETVEYIPATSLRVTDFYLGSTGDKASLIMLRDGSSSLNPAFMPCWLAVDNLQAYDTTYRAIVDVDGPLWHGDVKGGDLRGTRLVHRQTWGSECNVQVHDTEFVGLPRSMYWNRNGHVLEVRSPSDGQFTEWRCVKSGQYGTSTPPVWGGLKPLASTSAAIAGYVQNHGFITAALS